MSKKFKGSLSPQNGLHAIQGNPRPSYFSLTVSGTVFLKEGQKLQPMIYAHDDNDYTIHGESGFSIAMLNVKEGFNAELGLTRGVFGTGNTLVSGWRTSQLGGFRTPGIDGFNSATGIYTVKEGMFSGKQTKNKETAQIYCRPHMNPFFRWPIPDRRQYPPGWSQRPVFSFVCCD